MRQSEVYGYNFPLNWDDLMEKIKEAVMRQVEYEITTYEPYKNDIEMLSKSDNVEEMRIWRHIEKWIGEWCDEHIQII